MHQLRRTALFRFTVGLALTILTALHLPVAAQDAGGAAKPPLGKEQIEQLVAPIALYPDALLAQIFMASTYPLEIVEAARWSKANPKVTGTALEDAMQQQSWDPSVKSLTAFPQVLQMMSDKLDWTAQLGDAFLAQQQDVMTAVQALRARAQAAGNLQSNEQQTVVVEPAPAGQPQPQTIIIQPANPQVVYVPTYNPTVVYGAWPYPAYQPFYWYPPGYVATASILSFGVGMAVGAALWGNCNWGGNDVNINVNRYNSFNRTNINNANWSHNSVHRKGVQYRDAATRQRYGQGNRTAEQSREAFRGRAEQGRQQLARGEGGAAARGQNRADGGRAGDRSVGSADARGDRAGDRAAGNRSGAGSGQRQPGAKTAQGNARTPDRSANRGAGAFSGAGNGNAARQDSARGRASRQDASAWSGGGGKRANAGGGSRGGGGGRGGGSRGGGGGRR